MSKKTLILFLLAISFFLPVFPVSAGTVLSSHAYAWSNNEGYINFKNIIVDDRIISGYAWSANAGWIKFDPDRGGVVNDGAGNLSGSAWGEHLGWIDFDNVSINLSTGKFSGTATGSLVGAITFDCPNYCDVKTDWRQAGKSSGSSLVSSQKDKDSSLGQSPLPANLQHIQAINEPLVILPEQSGTYIKDTDFGQVILNIPAGAVPSKVTFVISQKFFVPTNGGSALTADGLGNNVFYDISVRGDDGILVHAFPSLITIVLPLPSNSIGANNMGAYWLNEANQQWVLIPDAEFSGSKVTFQMNYLTKFAILKTKTPVPSISNVVKKSQPGPTDIIESTGVVAIEEPAIFDISTQFAGLGSRDTGKFALIIGIFVIVLLLLLLSFYFWRYLAHRKKSI